MTSRTIRGLVPNLSGDNRCISSSAPFSFYRQTARVVMDKVTVQLHVCGDFF